MHSSLPNGSAGIDTPIVVDHLWTKQKARKVGHAYLEIQIWRYQSFTSPFRSWICGIYFVSTCAYLFLLHSGKVQRAFFKDHYQVTLFASLFDLLPLFSIMQKFNNHCQQEGKGTVVVGSSTEEHVYIIYLFTFIIIC